MVLLESTEVRPLSLHREEGEFKAWLGFVHVPAIGLPEAKNSFLHTKEAELYSAMVAGRRQLSFLQGRYIAKHTLMAYLPEDDPKKILIKPGIFQQPVIEYTTTDLPRLSIAHSENLAACLVFQQEHPMGIDLELVTPNAKENIASQLTAFEKGLFINCPEDENTFYTRIWTIKEALSKVLLTGLMTPFEVFEIASIDFYDTYTVSFFKNFGQYKAVSLEMKGNICSIVLPKNTVFSDRDMQNLCI
jgi:4'-phosphopantetheinyl transferase